MPRRISAGEGQRGFEKPRSLHPDADDAEADLLGRRRRRGTGRDPGIEPEGGQQTGGRGVLQKSTTGISVTHGYSFDHQSTRAASVEHNHDFSVPFPFDRA